MTQPIDKHDFAGRHRGYWARRWFSLRAALAGVGHIVCTQPNARIELGAAMGVVLSGMWWRVQAFEWGLLGLTICLVLACEAFNTAVETIVDHVSPEFHPLAKVAKDCAAGGMVFVVMGSLCVAAAIFGPRVCLWLFERA